MAGHRAARSRTWRDAVFVAAVVLGAGLLGLTVAATTGETDLSELMPVADLPLLSHDQGE